MSVFFTMTGHVYHARRDCSGFTPNSYVFGVESYIDAVTMREHALRPCRKCVA